MAVDKVVLMKERLEPVRPPGRLLWLAPEGWHWKLRGRAVDKIGFRGRTGGVIVWIYSGEDGEIRNRDTESDELIISFIVSNAKVGNGWSC